MALTRGASATLIAEFAKQGWHPVVMAYIDWPSGDVRAHSGVGTISYGGHDWLGIGDYGRVEVPPESRSGAARRLTLTLLGGIADLLTQSGEQVRGRDGEIYAGAVTTRSGATLVADPVRVWRGTADALRFEMGVTDEIVMTVEAALQLQLSSGPALRRNASQYHSLEDHKANFSATDTAARLIQSAETVARNMTWPE